MHHDSVPFRLSSSNHIYSVVNYCTIFRVLLKTYNVVSEYPLTPMERSHVEILKIKNIKFKEIKNMKLPNLKVICHNPMKILPVLQTL